MNLVFFIDSTRKIGGGSYSQFVFAKHLALRGHKVVIFAGDRNFYSSELIDKNLVVHYRTSIPEFRKGLGIGKINNTWRYIYLHLVIKPYLKKSPPDWLIGYLHQSAIDACDLGRALGIKVANFVYESPQWMEEQLGIRFNSAEQKYFTKHKVAYRNSTVLIPNSKLSAKYMKKWIPESNVSSPVYPGIGQVKSRPLKRDFDIIYLGRLHKLKNIDQLLMACRPEFKVVVLGAGEELEYLKELASNNNLNVNFLGSVSDDEKWEYLHRSKLLVCPTSFEGFGVPPLEGLACGCKVLCSNIPILKEIYGGDVEYFELNNLNELRSKINQLLNSDIQFNSSLTELYTWENAAIDIENILSSTN